MPAAKRGPWAPSRAAEGSPAARAVVDRVGRQLSRLQGQEHARRVDRVEEAEGVADQHPAVAGDARWSGRRSRGSPARGRPAWRWRGAGAGPGSARPPRRSTCCGSAGRPVDQVVEAAHDADAHPVVRQRDVPEPGLRSLRCGGRASPPRRSRGRAARPGSGRRRRPCSGPGRAGAGRASWR